MKKVEYLAFLVLIIMSCSQSESRRLPSDILSESDGSSAPSEEDSVESDSVTLIETTEKKEETLAEEMTNFLEGKAFDFGLKKHFTDSGFYFACDCCYSNLLFVSDSASYLIHYCMAETTLVPATHTIEKDSVIITTSGVCISENYNWSAEFDSTATPYYISDTIVNPKVYRFGLDTFDNRHLLKENHPTDPFYALQTSKKLDSILGVMEEKGLIDRLRKVSNEPID